jgi:molybdate transport system substrate-binding protein
MFPLPSAFIVRVCLVAAVAFATGAGAAEIRVAVASNFSATLHSLAGRFESHTGNRLVVSAGSTGKHYAQIINGAPFDVFFAADEQRPARLEAAGVAIPGGRFTYALGRLVLWSPRAGYVDGQGAVLRGAFRHLAIANPRLAPYGRAAEEVLRALGLWHGIGERLVRGENIAQAFQFVASGNAELGFVAYAQLQQPQQPMSGSWWLVPQALYSPIAQQAVLLRDHDAARELLAYVRGPEARDIIAQHGYALPGAEAAADAR